MRDFLQGELIILNQWRIRGKLAMIFKGVLENYLSVVIRIELGGGEEQNGDMRYGRDEGHG